MAERGCADPRRPAQRAAMVACAAAVGFRSRARQHQGLFPPADRTHRILESEPPLKAKGRGKRFSYPHPIGCSQTISGLNDDLGRGAARYGEPVAHARCDVAIIFGVRAIRRRRHDWRATIGLFTNGDIERHFTEEWNAEPLRFAPRATMTE